jgi:hypothetical protein
MGWFSSGWKSAFYLKADPPIDQNGSLRLNLTQHGKTHQVNGKTITCLGLEQRDEFASAAINSCGEAPYFGHERSRREKSFCSATPAGTGDASFESLQGLSEKPTLWRV